MGKILTIDMHTHLLEKKVNPLSYWKQASARKLDAVAITEHSNFRPAKAFGLLAERKPRSIALIPGMELLTSIGHVLAYGKDEGIFAIDKLYERGLQIKSAIRIAEKEDLLLCIAHPWGFSFDSAAYMVGEKKLEKLVQGGSIGVEAYNGMFGHLSNFIYGSSWVKKPINFFDFLEKNRVARKTRLSKVGRKLKSKLEEKSLEVLERTRKAFELAEKADFVVAGSDAHYASRVGAGIMKVKTGAGKLTAEKILQRIREKENVIWTGPYVRETAPGKYQPVECPIKKRELLVGLQYTTRKVAARKVKEGLAKRIGKKALKKRLGKLKKKLVRKKRGAK